MSVRDHGIEALRKAAIELSPGEYSFRTSSLRAQILTADDLTAIFFWEDFGTTNERITEIQYVSSYGTATKTFSYTLDSGEYRLDEITWS